MTLRLEERVANLLLGKVCCPRCGREGTEMLKYWACGNGECSVYRFLRNGTIMKDGWEGK